MSWKCEACEKELSRGDAYIKYEDNRYCDSCSEGYSYTVYTVGGEYLATDDDGVEDFSKWNEEEEAE